MGFQGLEGEKDKPDCFVVDMESLSISSDKVVNSRLALQRSLSRKGSQRGERKSTSEREGGGSDHGTVGGGLAVDGSPKGGFAPEKSVTFNIPIPGTPDPLGNALLQQVTQTNGENRSKKYNKQRSNWIDPWRVLFIFATLSSIGSLILIYVTLSMGKVDGDGNPQV